MEYIALIVGGFMLLKLYFSILDNKSEQISNITIILLLLYDWIFIHMFYLLPNIIVWSLKSFGELLIVVSTYLSCRRTLNSSNFRTINVAFIYFIGIPFIYSFLLSKSLSNYTINGYKDFFFPYILFFLLFKCKYLNFNYNILNYVSVIVPTGAIIQFMLYDGQLTSFWFYDYFNCFEDNPIETGYYNYLKENSLRATSCFVTPIDLSLISGVLIIYHFTYFMVKSPQRVIHFCLLLYSFIGLYLSQTRVGFAVVIIGVLTLFDTKKGIVSLKRICFIPIIFIILTFVFITNGSLNDDSSLGRVIQYKTFINEFSIWGSGISDYDAIFKYDSYILSSFKMMGGAAFLYFMMYFTLLKLSVKLFNSTSKTRHAYFVIASANSLIYTFAIQHLAGSCVLTLIIFLMFNYIYNPEK